MLRGVGKLETTERRPVRPEREVTFVMPATSENGQYVVGGTPAIANAFISGPGVNVFKAIPSSPGRSVQFRAGTAVIRDERDLIACLRDPAVDVVVERDYVDWIAGAMNRGGLKELEQARVRLPESFYLTLNAGQWELRREMELPDIDAVPLPEGVESGAWHTPKKK